MKKPITILSIDDDKEILYALQAIFDFQDWHSVVACNVESGIRAFCKHKPDIVVVDYHLPSVNGIEGVRRIRQLSNDVPIIVFTIDEDQEVANRFLEVGASDFALKPIKAPDLISRINLHIRLLDKEEKKENKILLENAQTVKGISNSTLELIKQALYENNNFLTVEEIADKTGLAYQTTYRYLQYMESENMFEVNVTYGKVGRPKNSYRLFNKGGK